MNNEKCGNCHQALPKKETPIFEQVKKIDWSPVIALAKNLVQEVEEGTYHDDNDYAVYIQEAVMQAVYGEDFYEKFNTIYT